jgi:UDP-3-O-[3-hydroxymyristoyl] glucosamine N-acyltransferase
VLKDVPAATFVSGYPAMPHDEARKAHAHMMRIPELKKRVGEIDQRLKALEEQA